MSLLRCRLVDLDASSAWDDLHERFATADRCTLGQGWRAAPEPGFRAGTVHTAWWEDSLYVYAVLDDDDIFNPVTEFNQPSFHAGDVFEIFLKPFGQDPYVEFHVNPNNQQFRLRIPSEEVFRNRRAEPGIPPEWLVTDPVLESRVQVDRDQNQWRVLAAISLCRIAEGDTWHVSFSRYDYTRGRESPVLSSTSPHPEIDFHRQQEWGRLRFER